MSKKKRTRGNIWNSPVHQAKPVEAKVLYSIRGSSFLAPFPLHRSGAASSPPVNQEEKMRDSSACRSSLGKAEYISMFLFQLMFLATTLLPENSKAPSYRSGRSANFIAMAYPSSLHPHKGCLN